MLRILPLSGISVLVTQVSQGFSTLAPTLPSKDRAPKYHPGSRDQLSLDTFLLVPRAPLLDSITTNTFMFFIY